MSFHEILIGIMAVFALLGGIDRILGSRFGLGPRFEEGILAMGTLGLAMIGIVCLAPVLARLLRPIVVPIYGFLGADPAMFAGTLLACDMGGASLARELALSPEAAGLGGILTGSMLGATVVFTIPVAMGLLRQEDRPAMAKGILCGIVAIPLGILAGGLTAGFPAAMVLRNLIPIVLIAALIALGLWRAENAMVTAFTVFGKIVVAIFTLPATIFSVLIFILGLLGLRQKFTYETIEAELQEPIEAVSAIDHTQNTKLAERIDAIIEEKQLFLLPNLKVSDIANELCTNRLYISHAINSVMHLSFSDSINKKRIEFATQLFCTQPNKPITDIALESGFASQNSFYRNFKNFKGCSPKVFARNHNTPPTPPPFERGAFIGIAETEKKN